MRITEKSKVRASAYDRNGNLIGYLYDSGFNGIDDVVNRLREMSQFENVVEVSITGDRGEYARYRTTGERARRVDLCR